MNKPYNTAFARALSQKKAVNLCIFLVIVLLWSLGISCRRNVTTTNQASMRPSSEAIAEANGLYEGRADLMKVRRAIRQTTKSPGGWQSSTTFLARTAQTRAKRTKLFAKGSKPASWP